MNAGFFGLDPTRTGYAKNRPSKESGTDFSAAVMRTLSPKTLSQFKVMAEILLAGIDFLSFLSSEFSERRHTVRQVQPGYPHFI